MGVNGRNIGQKSIPFRKSGLLTNLSVHDIEYCLCRYFDERRNIIVPNVGWGFFSEHEADLVVITKAGYLTEIEIKRSWSDFMNDFRKDSYHNDPRIKSFYYCIPECMLQPCLEYLDNLELSFQMRNGGIGVIYYTEDKRIYEIRGYSRKNTNPLTLEEIVGVARLGVLRFWSARRRLDNNDKDEKIKQLRGEVNFWKAEFEAASGCKAKDIL